ncbi:adenylate/guanylate cyclase domain-containing protein [Treponema sp. R80B11-R83G3]
MNKDKKFIERREGFRVRFPIGAKLIIIISIIVLASLGSITALVSWLVREDLKVSAEENNFEVNRRAAAETEQTLEKMRLLSLSFARAAALARRGDAIQEEADYFFAQNPQIAAIFYASAEPAAWTNRAFANGQFFLSRGIDTKLADDFRAGSGKTLENAALGQTALVNASPLFNTQGSTYLAAMFFPMRAGSGCVLFSTENLNESFGMGVNKSYLINADGDVIADADIERVKTQVNLSKQEIIRQIFNSPDNSKQMLAELDVQSALDGPPPSSPFSRLLEKIGKNDTRSESKKARYYLAYTRLNTAGSAVITAIEYDKVFEGINATTRRNIYLTAAILFLSVLCVWFFAKSISVPLKTLAGAARSIEGGIFNIELTPASNDEIGLLTSSFGKMCSALNIFGKFTNRDIAVQAMRGQIKPGGLSKRATIFFSDIRGFTEKSENFVKVFGKEASDRIVFWLNEYLSNMVCCVEKTNGIIDKFIGDAVMAHWGTAFTAGTPQEDAFNCVKAALMMRETLIKMNRNRKEENMGAPPIRIGCGINTGVVTAGQIGSDLRMEYTVIGDPVNLASRVEALNKPLGTDILITENTWNLVKKYFITEEMPSVTVKGKEKPVRLFAVVNFNFAALNKTPDASDPMSLADVRKRLGIKETDVSKADVNAEEVKYKIGGK